jgi:hypothetical protein
MPTVRCPEHGVFAYKTAACPGCAAKAVATQRKLAQDARSHWETEIARVEREIEKKRREFAEQVRVAESRLESHDRNVPEAPTGIGALFKQAAYDREYSDFLDRRNTLAARIADVKAHSAQYDEWIIAVNIGADVMTAMIRDMPEATDLFIAEEDRLECERAEAERKKAAVASALAALDEHYGGTHAMGSVDTDYSRSLLLGAVDMNGKRYARLGRSLGLIVCVPWIDAFAELVGREVSVYWGDRAKDDRVFHVTDADGNVDEEEI